MASLKHIAHLDLPGPSREGIEVAPSVDWYRNSRPIFTGGRMFALMGTDWSTAAWAAGGSARSAGST